MLFLSPRGRTTPRTAQGCVAFGASCSLVVPAETGVELGVAQVLRAECGGFPVALLVALPLAKATFTSPRGVKATLTP